MKKFEFKMQKILDLRKFEQQQAEADLGKANAEVARIQRELDSIAVKKASAIKAFDNQSDFVVQTQMQQFFYMLDQKKEKFFEEMAKAQIVADEKRAVVLECMKKTKSLEKLREKHLQKWTLEQRQIEAKKIDDVVTAKTFARIMKEKKKDDSE